VSVEGEPTPEGVVMGEQPIRTRKTKLPKCIWRKINGQHVLDEREMPTKYIPIVRVVGNQWIIEGKPVVSGLTRNAKDAQRMYNYNASMEVELNGLAPKAPIVAMAEQIEGHEDKYRSSNTVSLAYLPYNAVYDDQGNIVTVAAPSRMQPAMPQAAIITAKMAAADDIKSTTGQYDPSLGNNPQSKSGIALQREQVKSEVGTFHYVDNLRIAMEYAGAIMLDMAPKVYTGKRLLRILGEDGEPDYAQLDPTIQAASQDVKDGDKVLGAVYRLDVGKYDLVVTTGPSFTTKRQEASEFLTNALQSARAPEMSVVLTYLALKSNDWAGADEATEMVKKMLPPGLLPADGQDQQQELPPEVKAMMDQLKHAVGQAHGQLEAAKQALAERDATLKDCRGSSRARTRGHGEDVRGRQASARRDREGEGRGAGGARELEQAAATAAPEAAPNIAAMMGALDKTIGEMNQKITALEQSSSQIAQQLQTFEVAARMPAAA
jgi:hypothetical protein